jgi:hypothetical protein
MMPSLALRARELVVRGPVCGLGVVLAAIGVAFLVGATLLQAARVPVGYTMYWLIVLVMVGWLLGLGVAEPLRTRRMFSQPDQREYRWHE